jgi:tetratricopeptide (TPR) repeat protein
MMAAMPRRPFLAALTVLFLPAGLAAQKTPAPVPPAAPAAKDVTLDPSQLPDALRPSEQALFQEALALQQQNNPGQAVAIYLDLLRYYPDGALNEETLARVAECYRALGRFPDATATLQLARQKYPAGKFLEAGYVLQGEMLAADTKWDEAIIALRNATGSKNATLRIRALYLTGLCADNAGKLASARSELQALAGIEKDNPYLDFAELKLGAVLADSDSTKDATALFAKVMAHATDPGLRAEAAVRAGNAAYQAGNYKEAAADYETARRTGAPDFWKNLANLGLLQSDFALKDYASALALYKEARPGFPDKARAQVLFLAAESARLTGKNDDAMSLYDLVLKDFSNDPLAEPSLWGRLLIMKGANSPQLASEAARFLAKFPNSDRVFYVKLMRVDALFDQKQTKACLPMFTELVKDPAFAKLELPARASLWFRYGQAAYDQKDWAGSTAAFQQFLKTDPTNKLRSAALWLLGQALQEQGNNGDALSAWLDLTKNDPGFSQNELALWKSGLLAGTLNKPDIMRLQLGTLIQKYPQSSRLADANYWLAVAITQMRDDQGARPYWEKARSLNPAAYAEICTQRLIGLALEREDVKTLLGEVEYYGTLQAKNPAAPAISLDVYEWLAGKLVSGAQADPAKAEAFYRHVLAGTVDQGQKRRVQLALARLMSQQKNWGAALVEWTNYQKLAPDDASRSAVLLPLADAYVGSAQFDEANTLADQILRQNPEGIWNLKGRVLLGDIAYGRHNYAEAAKQYSAAALLGNDPEVTPIALQKSADAWRRAGNNAAADQAAADLAAWKKK